MAGLFIGLLLGLFIGVGGYWLLMRSLFDPLMVEAERECNKVRAEGLEAANRIIELAHQTERELYAQLLEQRRGRP